MGRIYVLLLACLCGCSSLKAQSSVGFADSIRMAYEIPELAFAVLSSDTIFEMQTIGYQRVNSNYKARPNDRFHLGSNTKAITALLAALLVKEGKIRWDTPFLELYPELLKHSKKAYRNICLQDLVTFRGKLPKYTYTYNKPTKDQITGDEAQQRMLLAQYFLAQKPMKPKDGVTPSNVDFILAGLMLERASGKSYKTLVREFGASQGIQFEFDYPNLTDTLQPWGHDAHLKAVPPFDNYKLNWLLSAGNINVDLAGYTKLIQLNLKGLKDQSNLLDHGVFNKLMFELPYFSFGWFNSVDPENGHHHAFNTGNAGAFISQVEVIQEPDRAYIIFANAATTQASEGIDVLLQFLKTKYGE